MTRTLAAAALLLYCATNSAAAQTPSGLTPEQWREDIQFVAKTIAESHNNPWHATEQGLLEAELAKLEAAVEDLQPYQITLELMRIVATIGDGHSQLRAWDSGLIRHYPLALRLFEDGIHVLAGQGDLARFEGAKITSIGTGDALEVWEAVTRYVARDNEWTLKGWTRLFVNIPEILHTLGYIDDMNAAIWTFELPDGSRVKQALTPIPANNFFQWRSKIETPDDAPLYRRNQDRAYWIKHFPEHETVYMRFNSVRNGDDGHFAGFTRTLITFIDENNADFLVVDARNNGGGNGTLLHPLIRRIATHERINRTGHLYLITDRITFSAAMMLVTRMDRATNVLFAGEPAGGKPNHYGDAEDYPLPNSGLLLRLSSLYHEESDPGDERPFQRVDIPVSLNAADYFANRDPVLDAVLNAIDEVRN